MNTHPLPKKKKAEQFDFFSAPKSRGPKRGRPRIYAKNSFGGSRFRNSNPRTARPMSRKKAIHLVLKSDIAKGKKSFLHKDNEDKVFDIIDKHAQKNGIKLYNYANGGNHLHILFRIHDKVTYRRFIRTITGLIARWVLKAEKGRAASQSFWVGRPFTRIVNFGKDYDFVQKYFRRNLFEAVGWIPYLPRTKKPTAEWRALWAMSGGFRWDRT